MQSRDAAPPPSSCILFDNVTRVTEELSLVHCLARAFLHKQWSCNCVRNIRNLLLQLQPFLISPCHPTCKLESVVLDKCNAPPCHAVLTQQVQTAASVHASLALVTVLQQLL